MRYYQVWILCVILLTLTSFSKLHSRQIEIGSSDDSISTRAAPHIEAFATHEYHGSSENIEWNTIQQRLTLQLDDHIAQQEPVVASNSTLISSTQSTLYVVWRDYRNDQGDIYAQMLDADGHRLWSEDIKVNSDPPGATQSTPAAAVDGEGELWVVWVDDRNGHNDIYAQGINTEGGAVWGQELSINRDTTETNQANPALAIDSSNDLIIAWHDNRNNGDFDIYAQKIDPYGLLGPSYLWPSTEPIHTNRNGGQTDPNIAVDGDGNVVVAWLDQRVGNGDIYAQRLQYDGQPAWDQEKLLNQQEHGSKRRPAVVLTNNSHAIISWLSPTETGSWIYINRIDSEGNLLGSDIQMSQDKPANFSTPPAITLLGDQSLAVGWKHLTDGHLYVDVRNWNSLDQSTHVQKIDVDGAEGSNNQSQTLSLAALPNNEIFAVWADSRQGRATDIYGQRLQANGTPSISTARLINESTGQIDQQNPAIAVDNAQNSILSWYARQGGESNLFLQKFNTEGEQQWSRQIQVSDEKIEDGALTPALATLEQNIFITWSDNRTGKSRVYVQQFDAEGKRAWPIDRPTSHPARSSEIEQYSPQIVTHSGDLFVVWQESAPAGSGVSQSQLAFQRLNVEGQPVWTSDQIIEQSGRTLRFPTLALVGEGRLAIAWTSTQDFATDLYFQLFDLEGGKLSDPKKANTFDGLVDQFNPPALGADEAGNLVVVWVDRRESGVYAQRFGTTASLSKRWNADFKVNRTPGTFSPAPDIAMMPGGDVMIVWQGILQGQFRTYAQRLDAQGQPLWAPSNTTLNIEQAILVSEQSREPWQPAVAVDDAGFSVIAWREERNMNQDIYLQRLNSIGDKLWPETITAVITDTFYHPHGSVESKVVDETDALIDKALLTYQGIANSGQITFSLTNNGEKWFPVEPGVIHHFETSGSDLRWQAYLNQSQAINLNHSPIVESIELDYTIHPSPTVSSTMQDSYEPDDTCTAAWPIQPNGVTQSHTLYSANEVTASATITDKDWISFQTNGSQQYFLLATSEDNQTVQMEVFNSCSTNSELVGGMSNRPGNPATHTSSLDQERYYVRISSLSQTTTDIKYQFSVRPTPIQGLAVIVAGQVGSNNNSHQTEVNQSADRAYQTLLSHGFTQQQIYYLKAEEEPLNIEPNELSIKTLKSILQEWTRQQDIGVGTPLLIYFVGRGEEDGFYLVENEKLTPEMLDLWLSNLEMVVGVDEISVIIEADYAGQFGASLAGPNRVIVAATTIERTVLTTARGFLFSEVFWLAMGQGYSIQQSFEIGQRSVQQASYLCEGGEQQCQKPLLEDPGSLAQMRGLTISSAQQNPVIHSVYVDHSRPDQSAMITVKILNGDGAQSLDAYLQSSITTEPKALQLEKPTTQTDSSVTTYQGALAEMPENGYHLITIYGGENSDLIILPYTLKLQNSIYLPYIQR